MRSLKTFERKSKTSPLRDIAIFFWAACVIGTTFLNLAFSVAPQTMVHLIRALMA